MAEVIEVSNRYEFQQQVIQASGPVMVDFYSPRYEKNKKLMPHLEALAKDYAEDVQFIRVDSDQADLLAADWKIRNTPTVILFVNGQPIKRWANELHEQDYRRELDKLVATLWHK